MSTISSIGKTVDAKSNHGESLYYELERKLLLAKNKRHELYEKSLKEKLNYEREIRKLESQNNKIYRYNSRLEMQCFTVDSSSNLVFPNENYYRKTSQNSRNPLQEISGNVIRSKSRDKTTPRYSKYIQSTCPENTRLSLDIKPRHNNKSEIPDLSPSVHYDESLFHIIDEIENMSVNL